MSASGRLQCLSALALLTLGLGVGPLGCFGGPTSDLPSKADEEPTSSDGSGNNNGEDDRDNEGSSTGGGTGAGSNGGGFGDAGASGPRDAGGGIVDNGDGAAPPCTWSTPANDAGVCGGSHCTTTRAQLSAAPGSVCATQESLDPVCSGDAQRAVHMCWRSNMESFGRAAAVKVCATLDARLASLNASCLDCYVALHECMSADCFSECGLESGGDCESCTNQKCVPAFTTCSGLTTP